MSGVSIQNAIGEQLKAESYGEQLNEFQKSIIAIPTGNITGFCSVDDLLENEKRKAMEPGKNLDFVQGYVDMSVEAAAHIKKFVQIATQNSLIPDTEKKWTLYEDRLKLFGGKKRVAYDHSLRAWDIAYRYDDGYPKGFYLTPNGQIDAWPSSIGSGWVPSKFDGCETLVKSLASVLIKAGITKVE